MSKKKYGYIVDAISGEIRSPDIYSCKYGSLSMIEKLSNISDLRIKVSSSNAFECSFCVYKDTDKENDENFNHFSDMNAIYIDGFDYFDIKIDLEQSSDIVKKVTGKSLAYSELSNGLKVTMEINTEKDMARKDYDSSFPTLFYRCLDDYTEAEKAKSKKASLLHRLLTFAPHYQLGHIDDTLWNEFRTFSFRNEDFISVLSAMQEELKCLFELEIKRETDGTIKRYIHAYDLEYCQDCYQEANKAIADNDTLSATDASENKINYHNTCNGVCLNNETHHVCQYGQVTDIFVSTENLTDSITLSSNKDSLKNMFQIKGGDDDITAAVKNINLSGEKIICFSQDMLNNMEEALKEKILSYQNTISSYEEEYINLMNYIYNSYDVILYLQSGKVPYHEKEEKKTLEDECCCLAKNLLSPNALCSSDLSKLNAISSKNIVKSATGFYLGVGYTTKVECQSYQAITLPAANPTSYIWQGTITVKDSEDENCRGIITFSKDETVIYLYGYDSSGVPSTSPIKTITCETFPWLTAPLTFSDDFKAYVNYKMKLASERYDIDTDDILMSDADFQVKINQSGLQKLNAYYSAYEKAMEVLQDTGCISHLQSSTEPFSALTQSSSLEKYCKEKYDLCQNRRSVIADKISMLQDQLCILNYILNGDDNYSLQYYHDSSITIEDILQDIKSTIDIKDSNGTILIYYDKTQNPPIKYSDLVAQVICGFQHYQAKACSSFMKRKDEISKATDLQTCLGELYPLLCSYLKEDVYENSNYISTGLNNTEILQKAKKLLDTAKRELKNACQLQYNISAPLSCLIAYISQDLNGVPMDDIYDKFILGNFIHFKIDDKLFRLRLSSIEFDYNSVDKITVEFTDVNRESNGVTDNIKGLLHTMSSIASSYHYTANQAEKTYNTHKEFSAIKKEGLDTALIHINSGINQSVVHDDKGILIRQYDDETDSYFGHQIRLNNGNIAFTKDNWKTLNLAIGRGRYEDKIVYGVWADALVGNLIVGNALKISDENGYVTITGDGIEINNGKIHLANDDYAIEIDPSHPSKNLFSIKDVKTNEVVMGIDTDGINRFKGHVYADEGTIGKFTIDNNGIYYKPKEQTYFSAHMSPVSLSYADKLGMPVFKENQLFKTYLGYHETTISGGKITSRITLDDSKNDMDIDWLENTLNAAGTKYTKHDINGNDQTLYHLDCVDEKIEVNIPIYAKQDLSLGSNLSLRGNINFDGSTNENSSGYTGTLGISYSGYNMIQFTPSIRGTIPVTKIGSDASSLTLSSCEDIRLTMLSGKMFAPSENNYVNLGSSDYKWKAVYATTGTIQTSDRNAKNSIEELKEDFIAKFILSLKPVRYKLNESDSNRFHWGLISQDIEETMNTLGMDSKDFAGFIKSPKTILQEDGTEKMAEGQYTYSLRYDEFIAPMIKLMQSQQNRIEKLEKTVDMLLEKQAENQVSC